MVRMEGQKKRSAAAYRVVALPKLESHAKTRDGLCLDASIMPGEMATGPTPKSTLGWSRLVASVSPKARRAPSQVSIVAYLALNSLPPPSSRLHRRPHVSIAAPRTPNDAHGNRIPISTHYATHYVLLDDEMMGLADTAHTARHKKEQGLQYRSEGACTTLGACSRAPLVNLSSTIQQRIPQCSQCTPFVPSRAAIVAHPCECQTLSPRPT